MINQPVLIACLCCAAISTISADHLWTTGSQRGVVLVWTPPSGVPVPQRYTIRRAVAGSGQWIEVGTVERKPLDSTLARYAAEAHRRQDAYSMLVRLLMKNAPIVAPMLGTYFEDTTTTPLTEYDYQIWADAIFVTERQNVISHQRMPPPPPEGIAARQRAQCIELWWNLDSTLAWGITAYAVYRSDSGKSPLRITPEPLAAFSLQQDTTTAAFLRDCSATTPAHYTYSVAAIDIFSNESLPTHISVSPATTFQQQPSLSDPVSTDGWVYITTSTGRDSSIRFLPAVRLSTTSGIYPRPSLQLSNSIRVSIPESNADAAAVAITAFDSITASWVSIPVVLPVIDTIAPMRPEFSELHRQGEHLVFRWITPTEADVAGYLVERNSGTDTARFFLPASVHSFADRVLTPARYRLRSIDAHGNSSPPTLWVTSSFAQQRCPALRALTTTAHGTLLAWEPIPWAATVLINRYDDDSGSTPLTIAQLSGRATSFVDKNKSLAWYQIVAIDSAGNYSMPSERRPNRIPQSCVAPQFDSIVVEAGAVVLFWSEASGDLLLERSTSTSDDVVVLAYISRDTRSYTDISITRGTQYTYRLRCIGSSQRSSSVTISIPP